MIGSINGVTKLDLPISMVSNIEDVKVARVSDNVINGMRNYYNVSPNLVPNSKKEEYRNRVDRLYKNLKKIKPIDNSVNGVVYLDNYSEKGIDLDISSNDIKQIWTEYRLIFNDHNVKGDIKMEEENIDLSDSYLLNNFDKIYDELSEKINGVGSYVDELNKMKKEVSISSSSLEEERFQFEKEKISFNEYMEQEKEKLEQDKKTLKEQMEKLESLVKVFDLKVSDILK